MLVSTVSNRPTLDVQDRPPSRISPEPAAGGGELQSLQARHEAGAALSPVETGTLSRLLDRSGGTASAGASADVAARSGKVKTVADFNVTGATKQDLADLKQTLAYLQAKDANGKPVSQTATDLLAKMPKGATIHIVHDGGDQYDPNTKVIDWDPRSGLTVTGGGTQSATLGLIHEIDHAVAGQSRPTPTGDGYQNSEEKRVIAGSETQIAHDLGEPTRTDHYGTTKVMTSSTAHTAVKSGSGQSQSPSAPAPTAPTAPTAPAEQNPIEKLIEWLQNILKSIF